MTASLSTIPALNGNIYVIGPDGGPFGVLFTNQLSGVPVNSPPFTFNVNTGNRTTSSLVSQGTGVTRQQINITANGSVTFNFQGIDATALTVATGNGGTSDNVAEYAEQHRRPERQCRCGRRQWRSIHGDVHQCSGQRSDWKRNHGEHGTAANTVAPVQAVSNVATLNRDGVGDEVQILSPRIGQATTFSFGGKAGASVTATVATPLTADAMFRALVSTNGTTNIPALGTITNPNIEVFGPDNGPFTVVFFSPLTGANVNDSLGLGKTNVPQFTSNVAGTVATQVQGQGNEVQNITFGTLGTLRFTYSGDPTPTDLTISAATTAAQLQRIWARSRLLTGNVQVLGGAGRTVPRAVH